MKNRLLNDKKKKSWKTYHLILGLTIKLQKSRWCGVGETVVK